MLGTAYRTAWRLYHRIREAMGNDPLTGPTLFGTVEVDEALIGSRVKGREKPSGEQGVGGWGDRARRAGVHRADSQH